MPEPGSAPSLHGPQDHLVLVLATPNGLAAKPPFRKERDARETPVWLGWPRLLEASRGFGGRCRSARLGLETPAVFAHKLLARLRPRRRRLIAPRTEGVAPRTSNAASDLAMTPIQSRP